MDSKILILDTELPERKRTAAALCAAGYRTIEAGPEDEMLVSAATPAALVLGGEMTDGDALRFLERLRDRGWRQPCLVRGHSDNTEACVAALAAGADDFVARQRDMRELVARLQAMLRRPRPAPAMRRCRFGRVTLDLERMQTTRDGQPLVLTRTERSLLHLLVKAGGHPVRRETLLQEIWGQGEGSRTRTIETHIWRLRKKIGEDATEPRWLLNHPNIGYSLVVEPVPGP